MLSNLSTAIDLHPWSNIEAGRKAATVTFRQSLAQLMLQSWCSWSTFPTQERLYLKLLVGPFITVIKFSRSPGVLPEPSPASRATERMEGSPPRKRCRVDEPDTTLPLNEVITREHAPQLVVWNHHIFRDPHDSTQGLSAALRFVLQLTTEDIAKGFDQGIRVEQSRIFNFPEFIGQRFEETKEARVRQLLSSP